MINRDFKKVEQHSKLSDQAFTRKIPRRHLGFANFQNRILLDFWLCHEVKHF